MYIHTCARVRATCKVTGEKSLEHKTTMAAKLCSPTATGNTVTVVLTIVTITVLLLVSTGDYTYVYYVYISTIIMYGSLTTTYLHLRRPRAGNAGRRWHLRRRRRMTRRRAGDISWIWRSVPSGATSKASTEEASSTCSAAAAQE